MATKNLSVIRTRTGEKKLSGLEQRGSTHEKETKNPLHSINGGKSGIKAINTFLK